MAMTIVEAGRTVIGGVDTHLDVHVAAALDPIGGVLGVESFLANPQGYKAMLEWMGAFGTVSQVGVEGTGAYGAGVAGRSRAGRASRSSRSTARTARPGGPRASRTRLTPSRRPGPCSVVEPPVHPSPATARWKPSGRCLWPSARLAKGDCGLSTRCASSATPPPISSVAA